MEVYRNEEEQIAALKNWWRANGAIFLLVLVLTVSFTAGWRYWSYRQQRHLKHAAILYQQLINVDSTPRSDTKALESHIRNNYKATLYLDFIQSRVPPGSL